MVVIRLSRGGTNKRPFYNIVVADKRCRRDGRCIERLGYFNPIAAGKDVRLHVNLEKAKAWIAKGAQPSDRVSQLLKTYEKDADKATQA